MSSSSRRLFFHSCHMANVMCHIIKYNIFFKLLHHCSHPVFTEHSITFSDGHLLQIVPPKKTYDNVVLMLTPCITQHRKNKGVCVHHLCKDSQNHTPTQSPSFSIINILARMIFSLLQFHKKHC